MKNRIGESALVIALFSYFWLVLASFAQEGSNPSRTIDTLGLPIPKGVLVMQPIHLPIQPGVIPIEWSKVIVEPVVAKENIGFYNSSDHPLIFALEIDGQRTTLTLGAKEILTMRVTGHSDIKGILGSGDTDTSTAFVKGSIYVLKPQGGKWIFSKL